MRCLTNCREIRSKIAERLPAEARSDLWSYEDFAVAFERASDGLTEVDPERETAGAGS